MPQDGERVTVSKRPIVAVEQVVQRLRAAFADAVAADVCGGDPFVSHSQFTFPYAPTALALVEPGVIEVETLRVCSPRWGARVGVREH